MSPSSVDKTSPSLASSSSSRSIFAVLAALSLAGCAKPEASPPSERATFRYADEGGSQSRVERAVAPDGSEKLHAVTEISAGRDAPTRITEDVQLDARGHLVRAEIAGAGAGSAPDRVVLDAAEGTVILVRSGEPTSWSVPIDLPWVYPQVLDARGRAITTPVAAWVAARAAEGSASVRVLEPDLRQSHVVPRDQLAAPTEAGTTVILGWDGADVGAGGRAFVTRVRIASLGTTLSLGGAPTAAAALPCR